MNSARILEWCLRWFAGLVFIYAAATKILVPCELAADIYQYRIAPGAVINIVAIILPSIELVLGACLITGIAPRGAALGITIILGFFLVLLTVNLFRGIDFECGCFGGDIDKDICHRFAVKIQENRPDMDRLTFVRIRTVCDIIRDLVFMTASWGSFILIRRRLKRTRG